MDKDAKSIDELKNDKGEIDYNGIKAIIPYEYPFVMIDRVLELTKEKIVAQKNVSGNEEFLKGHFRDFPIMPGVMIVEGVGQAGTLLGRYNVKNHHEKDFLAFKIKEAKFISPVFPGDVLIYEVIKKVMDEKGAVLEATVKTKDGKDIAMCELTLAVVDKKRFRSMHSPFYK